MVAVVSFSGCSSIPIWRIEVQMVERCVEVKDIKTERVVYLDGHSEYPETLVTTDNEEIPKSINWSRRPTVGRDKPNMWCERNRQPIKNK